MEGREVSSPSVWKPVTEDTSAWKPVAEAPKEKPGALERFGTGLYKSTVGPVVDAVQHPGEALKSLADVPAMEEIAKHIKEGNYGHAALAIGKYAAEKLPGSRQIMQGVQTAEPVAQDVKEGNLAGAAGRVTGTAAMAAAPELLGRAGAALADTKVGAGLKGAVTAAAPDLASGAGMIAGGEALAQVPGMAYPAHIAMAYPAAKLIKSGLVKGSKGWKAAVDARAAEIAARANDARLAADAATIPPDVMAELTRESGAPDAVPQGEPIPGRAPAWEDEAALARLEAEKAARAQPAQPPPAPEQYDTPKGPVIGAHKAAGVQPNFGGNVLRPPLRGQPQTATLEELAANPPQPAPVQTQAAAAGADTSSLADLMQSLPAATRKPMAHANYRAVQEGNAAAETAGPAYEAAGRANKVENLAKALDDAGVTHSDMLQIPEAQRVDYISKLAKEAGENKFSATSVDALMTEMKRLASKPKAAAEPTSKLTGKALEIAKQLKESMEKP